MKAAIEEIFTRLSSLSLGRSILSACFLTTLLGVAVWATVSDADHSERPWLAAVEPVPTSPAQIIAASAPHVPAIAESDAQPVVTVTQPQPQTVAFVQPEPQPAAEPVAVSVAPQPVNPNTFDERPLRKVRTIKMMVTGYSPDERSCGIFADGITASGYSVWTNGMKLVAADTRLLPFGSVISVPGYNDGKPVPVLDRGGAIKGKKLDLLFPTHEIARRWGRKTLEVTIWEYAD